MCANLTSGGDDLAGGWLRRDPHGGGRLQFANSVAAFATDTGRSFEVEVACEQAVISSLGGDSEFLLREAGGVSHRGHPALRPGTFPPFTRGSSTASLIMDLVHARDTGEPPSGGTPVTLPLAGSDLRLERDATPRQPRFER